MNDTIENIGARIAAARKNKEITQSQLAELLSVSPQAVSKWENGLAYPDIMMLPRIAEFLEVSMDELFGMNPATPKPAENNFEFPETYRDQPLVAAFADRAVYSSAKVVNKDEDMIRFDDGSEVDLYQGVVINRGQHDIHLVYAHQMNDAVNTQTDRRQENTSESRETTAVRGYRLDIGRKAEIIIRQGEENRWKADGSFSFMKDLDIHKTEDGILNIRLNEPARKSFFGHKSKSAGRIEITTTESLKESLVVRFRCSGSLVSEVNFRDTAVNISGSANVFLHDSDNLDIKIAGSGDVSAHQCKNLTYSIAGSGSIFVEEINGELLRGRTAGSGDVKIARGHVDSLDVKSSGSGGVTAQGLEVEQAKISIAGSGAISLGTIFGESVEHVVGSGRVKVNRRF